MLHVVLSLLPISPAARYGLFVLVFLCIIWLIAHMTPKRFYIVRHGQTLLNAEHVKQGAEGALSAKGEAQAEEVGRYLSRFPLKAIYTSPYERAVQTAEIIARHANANIIQTPLLAERKNPSEVIGKSLSDPNVRAIVARIEKGYHENNFRYADEENFEDLKKRAAECLSYLRRHAKPAAAVVTHHAFLQMLLSYMLYRERLDASSYVKLAFFNPAENGGITICEYHPWKRLSRTRGWEVVAYNESLS